MDLKFWNDTAYYLLIQTSTNLDAGAVIHQDEIFSHYQPWQAVYKVGAGGEPK